MKKYFDFSNFKGDVFGGVTAGIVALPLALAFGEQSGLGAAAGLYGAAFLAFFAALFGGTNTQISGPTAPMTALSMILIANIIQENGGDLEAAVPYILLVFLLAGIFQIAMGVLKLGTFIKFIPSTVVSGFMSGIGVIIIITQILPAVGYYSGEDEEVVENFAPLAEELILERILEEEASDGVLVLEEFDQTIERANQISQEDIRTEAEALASNASKGVIGSLKYMARGLQNINYLELALSALTIFIIYGFKRITTAVPSTLIALLVVSGGAYYLGFDYIQIKEIPAGYPTLHLEMFSGIDLGALTPYIITALMLSLLGAIDSLLTSVVADNLTKTRHDSNKELMGQGIGNSISSMFGGIPGAGATIRTVVNIQSGGKTRISGMMAGVLLFVMLIALGPVASQIPAAVLAGILITVGIGVMDYKGLKALPKMETSEKVILLTVLLLTVFWQLVYAVGIGLILAALVFLKRMGDVSATEAIITDLGKQKEKDPYWEDELKVSKGMLEKVFFKHLNGPLFFGFVSHFRESLDELKDINLLVIRMKKVPFIDQSGLNALENTIEDLHKRGVIVVLSEPNDQVMNMMRSMKIVPGLLPERHIFGTFEECRIWLHETLTSSESLSKEQAFITKKHN